MTSLFPVPAQAVGAAANALALFQTGKHPEAIALCQKELAALEKQIPARSNKPPQEAEPGSVVFQYYALTNILVNALAARQEWKAAKQVLGKYRVHFPRDPWGFETGAEVTRRVPNVRDQAAVQRAIELLEGEAQRLRAKT